MDDRVIPQSATGEGSSSRTAAFVLLASVQVVVILAMSMLSVCLPEIRSEFHASDETLALITAAYAMSFSGLLLLGGRQADSGKPRRSIEIGVLLFAAGSLISMSAPTMAVLLLGRFVQGAACALVVPACMALVHAIYPEPERHARAMAVWGVLTSLGGILGLLYGGAMSDWLSWRWTFLLPLLVSAGVLALTGRLLPRTAGSVTATPLDPVGAVTATIALAALSYGLVIAPINGWTSVPVLLSLACGCLSAISFVVWENRVENPLLPLDIVTSRARIIALVAVFLAAASITTLFYMLSLYFQAAFGWSALQTSLGFLPIGAGLLLTSLAVGTLMNWQGPPRMLSMGLLVTGAGLWLLGGLGNAYSGMLLAGLIVFPVGVALTFSAATVLGMRDSQQAEAGRVGGVINAAMEAGPTLGLSVLVSVAGAVAGHHDQDNPVSAMAAGFSTSLRVAAVVMAVVSAVVLLWYRSTVVSKSAAGAANDDAGDLSPVGADVADTTPQS
jgi:MFS family permease